MERWELLGLYLVAAVAGREEEDLCEQNLNKGNFLDLYTLSYTLISPSLMSLLESSLIYHFAKINLSLSSEKLFEVPQSS